ncbi:MAG TPA: TolC family protein [Candidatus Saccharimonadales bacterium]|nr:TolC family protein [Candidatus Saccharimonadales bacterium]
MIRRWISISLVFLAGCVRFHPVALSPERVAAELDNRSLTNTALKVFLERNLHRNFAQWPAPSWDFDMLVLTAFYYEPSLSVARAEWSVARGGIETAAGRLNPTVSMTGGYDTGIAGNFSPWMPAIVFDLPLETAGKRKKRMEQALHLSDAARWNIATVAWQVRGEVRANLLELYTARETQALAAAQAAAQADAVRLLEGQAKAGSVSAFEASQTRMALDRARLTEQQARGAEATARAALAVAMGVPSSALKDISFDFAALRNYPKTLTLRAARQQAVLHRPDILAALSEYEASQDTLRLEIARQYPDVHLNPGYLWNQGNQGDSEWQLGLSVELPVFNRNQGPVAEAQARRISAAARFRALQAKVLGEVDLALAGYQSALQESAVVQTFSETLRDRLDSVLAQQKAGEADPLTVANARVEFYAGAAFRLETNVKISRLFGQLEDAVQNPLTMPGALLRNTENNPYEP